MNSSRIAGKARTARVGCIAMFAVALASATGLATARPVHYQCTGYQPLDASFTPMVAQLHFQGKDWTLKRVRDSREARYVGTKAGAPSVTLKQSAMSMTLDGQALECKLISDALAQFNQASAPAATPNIPVR